MKDISPDETHAAGSWRSDEPPKDGTLILCAWDDSDDFDSEPYYVCAVASCNPHDGGHSLSWYYDGISEDASQKDPDRWAELIKPKDKAYTMCLQ